jgi:hypothetical protein
MGNVRWDGWTRIGGSAARAGSGPLRQTPDVVRQQGSLPLSVRRGAGTLGNPCRDEQERREHGPRRSGETGMEATRAESEMPSNSRRVCVLASERLRLELTS